MTNGKKQTFGRCREFCIISCFLFNASYNVRTSKETKVKGSNNWYKARLKVAKLYEKVSNIRRDNLNKVTTKLIQEDQLITVETLNVKGMMKNHNLAQAIGDASWGELVRQLEYKANWYGRTLVKIDQWFPSSKRCSSCGHTLRKLPLSIREWDCPQCGTHHDRDINAAKNILAAGLAVSVCGATVRPEQSKSVKAGAKSPRGRKQKPKS